MRLLVFPEITLKMQIVPVEAVKLIILLSELLV